MIQLHAGNVLLKPSHRKQVHAWLRRANRIGDRIGNFILDLTLSRCGRSVEVNAKVHHSGGDFTCRARRHDWRDTVREVINQLVARLHTQWMLRAAVS